MLTNIKDKQDGGDKDEALVAGKLEVVKVNVPKCGVRLDVSGS